MGDKERANILAQCEQGTISVTEHLTGPRSGLVSFRYCLEGVDAPTLEGGWEMLLKMQDEGKLPGHDWEYEHDPCGKSWETCSRCRKDRRL